METIGRSEVWSYFTDETEIKQATNTEIRNGPGHTVTSYLDLAKKVASLQFKNPEHVLLFRGQSNDYLNQKKNTSLKPSLFRPMRGTKAIPDESLLGSRFNFLHTAERSLVSDYCGRKEFEGNQKLKRHRILRWAILQHYEICFTPLLDVTHSLRIAASFGSEGATDHTYLYVLGVPNISGSVTASAESGLQIVRLSSVCPPSAVRPHIQEGYLLGEYPDMPDFDQKQHYGAYEIDFGRRLVAKFRFDPSTFWSDPDFPKVGRNALYPLQGDPLNEIAERLKLQLGTQN